MVRLHLSKVTYFRENRNDAYAFNSQPKPETLCGATDDIGILRRGRSSVYGVGGLLMPNAISSVVHCPECVDRLNRE